MCFILSIIKSVIQEICGVFFVLPQERIRDNMSCYLQFTWISWYFEQNWKNEIYKMLTLRKETLGRPHIRWNEYGVYLSVKDQPIIIVGRMIVIMYYTLSCNSEFFYLFRETPANYQLFHLWIQAQNMAHLLMMELRLQTDWPKTVQ